MLYKWQQEGAKYFPPTGKLNNIKFLLLIQHYATTLWVYRFDPEKSAYIRKMSTVMARFGCFVSRNTDRHGFFAASVSVLTS
jgi:hypothetical protein